MNLSNRVLLFSAINIAIVNIFAANYPTGFTIYTGIVLAFVLMLFIVIEVIMNILNKSIILKININDEKFEYEPFVKKLKSMSDTKDNNANVAVLASTCIFFTLAWYLYSILGFTFAPICYICVAVVILILFFHSRKLLIKMKKELEK